MAWTPGLAYWVWKWTALVGSFLLPLVLLAARRRLPGWAKTLLLATSFMLLTSGTIELVGLGISHLVTLAGLGEPGSELIAEGILSVPFFLIYSLPYAAALLDRRRRQRPGWSYLEWTGAVLALLHLLTSVVNIGLSLLPDLQTTPEIAYLVGWLVLSMPLSAFLGLWLVPPSCPRLEPPPRPGLR